MRIHTGNDDSTREGELNPLGISIVTVSTLLLGGSVLKGLLWRGGI
jgi:hypothetical protein